MDDLTTFLRARLDEDAQVASTASPGPWKANGEHDEVLAVDGETVADGFALSGRQLRATVDHIARHDPPRVLREVEAKRRLVDWHTKDHDLLESSRPTIGCRCYDGWPCTTLRLLALPYADHPDYRGGWKP